MEQLRYAYGYNENKDEYYQDLAFNRPYPPFGEVVNYRYNSDGTITLYVDGVWPDYNTDYAFVCEVVVRPLEGAEFRIVSNTVCAKEKELPTFSNPHS